MLSVSKLDRISLSLSVPKNIYWPVDAQFTALSKYLGVPLKKRFLGKGSNIKIGRSISISIGEQTLRMAVCRYMKSTWISYEFNNSIDTAAFEGLIAPLMMEASLYNAMTFGRLKHMELSIDYFGLDSNDYLFHNVGVKSSYIIWNEAKTGASHYMGSAKSQLQLVAYDKNQHLLDSGLPAYAGKVMRIEARINSIKSSLVEWMHNLGAIDPFQGFIVCKRNNASLFKTDVPYWSTFLGRCTEVGVAAALAESPSKKTFLSYLEKLKDSRFHIDPLKFSGALHKMIDTDLLLETWAGQGFSWCEDVCN